MSSAASLRDWSSRGRVAAASGRARTEQVRPVTLAAASAAVGGLAVLPAVGGTLSWVHAVASALFIVTAVVVAVSPAGSVGPRSGRASSVGVLQEAWTVASLAVLGTVGLGFLLDLEMSRYIVITQGLCFAVIAPGALALQGQPRDRRRPLRVAAVCSDAEFRELVAGSACPSATRSPEKRGDYTVAVRFVAPLGDGETLDGIRVASLSDLKAVCAEEDVEEVVTGRGAFRTDETIALANEALAHGITFRSQLTFFEQHLMRVPLVGLHLDWFLDLTDDRRHFYRRVQYVRDSLAAMIGLVVLGALLPVLAAAIVLDSGRPVFFRQTRVGLDGRVFEILKLRTMRQDAEAGGPCFTLTADARITRLGRLLRRTRLDELPQVINVIRGEMAFVGPRPERPEFVSSYSRILPHYDRRHCIRPGITGWAQVTEGYASGLADTRRKLERDLFYLKHQSAALDTVILVRTLTGMLRLSGR